MKKTKPKPVAGRKKAPVKKTEGLLKKDYFAAAIIIFITAFVLYFSTWDYKYVLDDKIVITENVFTNKGFAGLGKIFSEESFTGFFQQQKDLVAGSRYRPLSIATFAIEREFFQSTLDDGYGYPVKDSAGNQLMTGNPAVSHLINALLYALSALLWFMVLLKLIPAKQGVKWYLSVPFAATLLFVVHPLHTEVVANIKGRDEILSLLFSLAALYYALRYIDQRKIMALAAGAFSYFLALLSKENALTFLLVIPVTVWFFRKTDLRKLFRLSIPFLIITILYIVIRIKAVGFIIKDVEIKDIMNNPFYGMSLGDKMATIIYTLGLYIRLLFIPHPLTHDYYPYVIPVMKFTDWRTVVSLLVYILLGIIAAAGWKKKSVLAYSILFFMITLSITSNIVLPVGTFMNERFIYMSSAGFCLALSYLLLDKLPGFAGNKRNIAIRTGAALLAALAVWYSALTWMRISAWENNYKLYETDVVTSANSTRVNCYMGMGLFKKSIGINELELKKKLWDSAEVYIRKSLEIYPRNEATLQMVSVIASERFKYDNDAEKILKSFTKVILGIKNPAEVDNYLAWMNRQGRYDGQLIPFYHHLAYEELFKKRQDAEKARKYIEMGLQLQQGNTILKKDYDEIVSSGALPKTK